MLNKNKKYLFYAFITVLILSFLFFEIESNNIIFDGSTWENIFKYAGFSLTLIGVVITIWLYNYITYDDVKKSINEENYLSNKGLGELKSDLKKFAENLNSEKDLIKNDFNPQINTIKYYHEMISNNPNSILSPYKNDLRDLVSLINKSSIGKKANNQIQLHTKLKMIEQTSKCIRSIAVIEENLKTTKKGRADNE